MPDGPDFGWEFKTGFLFAGLFQLSVDLTIIRPCADTITAHKHDKSRLGVRDRRRRWLCHKFLMKIIEKWLLFKYVDGQFTPLSKPFKTKDQAEKARLRLPVRVSAKVGLFVQYNA
jgi:hypothetical protein